MNIYKKIIDKLFIKQWNIAVGRVELKDIFNFSLQHNHLKWYPVIKINELHADPFILKNPQGGYYILYEKLCKFKGFGEIHIKSLDINFNTISSKVLLEFDNHLSYPSVYSENYKTYIIPESSEDGNLYAYEFDFENVSLKNRRILIENMKLLDSTILKYDNKYWIFSTQRGSDSNKKLLIHYSENLFGPYTAHKLNPFKNNSFGCRSAGNIFEYSGFFYRPTQNCTQYYGSSIVMNKLVKLNEDEFIEEFSFEIKPETIHRNIKGIHTINFLDNVVVLDGLKKIFAPIHQVKIYLNKLSKSYLYL